MFGFTAEGREVKVYPAERAGSPAIYLNTYAHDNGEIYDMLRGKGCDCTLVTISRLHWNSDMCPWDAPPLFGSDAPCRGGADGYIRLLESVIVPQAERALGEPRFRGIAGYSLGGLFAVYSAYATTLFSRTASMSGSLWYPGIKEYIFSREQLRRQDRMYFSLGDKEKNSRSAVLRTVQQNTEEIESFCRGKGIRTTFVLEPGNHFKDINRRTADGIAWLLGE